MHEQLRDMHRNIQESTGRRRKNAVDTHIRRTHVRTVNFSIVEFVLKGETKSGPKLRLKWTGPYVITQCQNEFLFTIEDLTDGKISTAHGRRVKLFRNSEYEITQDILHHLDYQRGELLVVESFENIRDKQGQIELKVKWRGFDSNENDWLSIETLKEDVPQILSEHLSELVTSGTPRQRAIAKRLVK